MWQVIFPKNLFEDLNKFLFDIAPSENGCFLLANSYRTKDGKPIIIITGVIKPDDSSWNSSGAHSLEPSSTFINKSVVTADVNSSSLIFVHTHPNPMHPAKFSLIDEQSNERIFANLSQILTGRPLGSFVFSRHGMYGIIFDKNKQQPVSNIKVSGNTIYEFPCIGSDSKSYKEDPMFDRQIRALGKQNQKRLQELKVTIIGAGGTGSPLAVQLARMGIKKIRLVDRDILDKTNIPRVYGSTENDIDKSKVSILKKHIESFSKTNVEILQVDVAKDDVASIIVDSDVIFSCTDNLLSRSILNDISLQYYIPLIDVGCRIHLNKDGSISQAIMKVQTVTPDGACLWCTGTLDGKLIMQEESLTSEEKKKLAKEGYYEDIEKQPSIISMTTMVASMAINKLLNLLGVFGPDYSSMTQIELKDGFMIDANPKIKENCICEKKRGNPSLKTKGG